MTTPADAQPWWAAADGFTLAQIRAELAHLLAMADTAERPRPTRTNPADHAMPGKEWVVNEEPRKYTMRGFTWTIRTLDDPQDAARVYVSTPDCYAPGEDFAPITPSDARRVGLALLAAADRADHVTLGVPRLEDHRTSTAGGAQ